MEVPAKFKSVLVGLRYSLLAFSIVAISAFLVSCGNTSSTKITKGPDNLTISLSSDTTHPGETVTVLVTVIDDNGDPIEGLTVELSISPNTSQGMLSALSGITDFNGQVSIDYTAGPDAGGDDVINARVIIRSNGIKLELNSNATIAVDPTLVGSLTITTGSSSLVADGAGSTAVRASVIDVNGAAVVGQVVTFSTTLGALSSLTASTNVDGVAQVSLTAGTIVGTAVVGASASGFNSNAQVAFIANTPTSIILTPTPTTIAPLDLSTLLVTVTDIVGNPVVGETVIFSIDTNISGGAFSALEAITNINGQATVTYTAGGTSGTDTIRARTSSNGIFDTEEIEVDATGVVFIGSIQLTAGATQLVADGTSFAALRVIVKDINGQPAPGVTVTFSTTLGTLSDSSAVTNANGVAQVNITSSTVAGTATIIAAAGGFLDQLTMPFVTGAPDSILITASPTSIIPLDTSTIIVSIEDEDNNPVVGETIIFSIDTNNSGGSFSALTAFTDINGQAVVQYTGGPVSGTDTIRARTQSNGIFDTQTITVTPGAVVLGSLVLSSTSTQLVADGSSFTTLRAVLTDLDGRPVAGVAVAFSSTLGTITGSPATTNATGMAQAILTAGFDLGTATVTASAGGFNETLPLPFVADEGTGISVVLSPDPINPLDTTTLIVTLLDTFGSPKANETIIYSIDTNTSGGGFASLTSTTDINGQTTMQYTAGGTAGTDVLRVRSASDASVTTTASLTVAPGSITLGNMTLISTSSSLIADGTSFTTLRATLTDTDGNPAPGVAVAFTSTLGIIGTTPVVTGPDGIAQTTLTSSSTLGTATATAAAGGFNPQVQIPFVPDGGVTLTMVSSPTAINPLDTTSVMITLVDGSGNPIQGETIIYSINVNTSGGSFSTLTATTDINGQVVVQYTAGPTPAPGPPFDTIRARISSDATVTATNDITVSSTAVAAGSLTLTTSLTTLVVDGSNQPDTATLRATLQDINGNPVLGATVFFTTTLGTTSAPSAITNAAGVAQVDLLAGAVMGTATATAYFGGFADQQIIQLVAGPPATLTMTASPTTVSPLDTTAVMVDVVDTAGNPVQNEIIIFSISTNTSGGSFSTLNALTDINGQAVVQYTAGPTSAAGPPFDTIRARTSTDASVSDTEDITVSTTAVAAGSLTLTTSLTTLIVDGVTEPDTATLRATLRDINGNPVLGATVFFTTTLGSTSAPSALTNSAGVAQVDLLAGPVLGTATAVAHFGGFADQQVIQLVAGPPATLTMTASPTTVSPLDTTSVMVDVVDAAGNPVQNEVIIFSIDTNTSGGSFSALSALTNINGQAVVQYTAGPSPTPTPPPFDTIRARTTTDASVFDTEDITVSTTAVAAGSLTMTTSATTLIADGVNEPDTATLSAILLDVNGDSVPGAIIFFTTTLGSTSAPSATTNTAGVAQVDLLAGTVLGTATATAHFGGFSDQQVVEIVAGPPAILTITATPTSINILDTTAVMVDVVDAAGNPVQNETIIFSIDTNTSGGSFSTLNALTDINGQAVVQYTAGPSPTPTPPPYDTIRARTATDASVFGTEDITVSSVSVAAGSLTMTTSASTLIADGVNEPDTATLAATLRDINGDPIVGATVFFTTTLGATSAPSATTNAAGVAQVDLLAGSVLGSATATAYFGGFSDQQVVQIVAGPPAILTFTASPTTIDVLDTTSLLVGVEDAAGNPVVNETIIFSIDTNTSGGSFSTLSVVTDINGQAVVQYTAGPSPAAGPPFDTLRARTATDVSVFATEDITVSTTAVAAGSLTLVANVTTLVADGVNEPDTAALSATLRDINGDPIVGATVFFTTTLGTTSAPSATTNTAGVAQVDLLAGTTPGTATAVAYFGGFSDQQQVQFVPGPATTINMDQPAAPATTDPLGSLQVLVTVTDAAGNLIPNETVLFSLSTNNSGAGFSALSAVTDSNGQATVDYTAGGTSGVSDTIRARLQSDESILVQRAVAVSGTALIGSISVTTGSSTLVADGASSTSILATVLDTDSNPAAGVTVTFTTTAGSICSAVGPCVAASTAVTNSSGIATLFLESATNLGIATITADTGAENDSTTVTFIAGPATTITLSAGPANLTADGVSTSVVTAYVVDADSNPVADGQSVFFSITAGDGSLSPLSATTVNGFASVTYTAGTDETINTGDVDVHAEHTNSAVSVDVTPLITLIGETIATINLTIDTSTLLADGITTTPVRATVTNTSGNPVVDGTTVTFTTTGGAFPGGGTDTADTVGGTAVIILTSSTTAGQYIVTATAGGVGQVDFVTFTSGPADSTNTSLSANPGSMPADGASTSVVTLIALDVNTNPVADGTTVNFYTTAGILSAATTATANGIATVTLTSSTVSATATVTAVVDGVTETTTVNMGATGGGTGTASYIELSVSTSTIRVQGAGGQESAVITATAYDETGSLIDDCAGNIEFSIVNGPGGGEELDGVAAPPASPVSKTTVDGTASVSLTSGTVSGTISVQAEVVEDSDCVAGSYATALTTPIAIEAGEPANIIIFQSPTVTGNPDGSTSQTFSALAQDLHGNPVENGTVIFFGLIDNSIPNPAPPPADLFPGYLSSGEDGITTGTTNFASPGEDFAADGVVADDILIILEGIDEGGHRIAAVEASACTGDCDLTLYSSTNGSETALDFVAGFAEFGVICGSTTTGNQELDATCTESGGTAVKGIAHTRLTWPPQAIFKPFYLYAESVGGDVGDTFRGTYPAVAPVTVAVSITQNSALPGTVDIPVLVQVTDGNGNSIQNEAVFFTSSDPAVTISGANPVFTDANGFAFTNIDTTAGCLSADVPVTISGWLASGISGTASFTVLENVPTANFTFITASLTATYTDASTTPVGTALTAWSWVFTGGTPGTDGTATPPAITYAAAGTYTTTLTVTNSAGCVSAPTFQSVTIPP